MTGRSDSAPSHNSAQRAREQVQGHRTDADAGTGSAALSSVFSGVSTYQTGPTSVVARRLRRGAAPFTARARVLIDISGAAGSVPAGTSFESYLLLIK